MAFVFFLFLFLYAMQVCVPRFGASVQRGDRHSDARRHLHRARLLPTAKAHGLGQVSGVHFQREREIERERDDQGERTRGKEGEKWRTKRDIES